MSTSYYIKNKQNKEVELAISNIPHEETRMVAFYEYYKSTKIGQTSLGWVFFLEEEFDLPLSEVYELLQDKYIFDEYDREIKRDDLFKKILSMSDRETQGKPYFELKEEVFNGETYRYDIMKGGY